MRIYLASGNAHKAEEIAALLQAHGAEFVDLGSAVQLGGMPEVEENADSFHGNARIKARALATRLPDDSSWALADDSGLEVDALDGGPGVRSARFAGVHGDDAANNRRLLEALEQVPEAGRTARFRCVLVLTNRRGEERVAEGSCHGTIAFETRGAAGFGYDPLFVPDGYRQTFGELGPGVKAELSHRARAVEQLAGLLRAERSG